MACCCPVPEEFLRAPRATPTKSFDEFDSGVRPTTVIRDRPDHDVPESRFDEAVARGSGHRSLQRTDAPA